MEDGNDKGPYPLLLILSILLCCRLAPIIIPYIRMYEKTSSACQTMPMYLCAVKALLGM